MFEATRLLANSWSAHPVAASYVSFLKLVCKLDSSVKIGAPQEDWQNARRRHRAKGASDFREYGVPRTDTRAFRHSWRPWFMVGGGRVTLCG